MANLHVKNADITTKASEYIEKIIKFVEGLIENGPITIVAFGDSITHGAVAEGEINYETVYWNRLKQKINNLRCCVPVNVILIIPFFAFQYMKFKNKQIKMIPKIIHYCWFGRGEMPELALKCIKRGVSYS